MNSSGVRNVSDGSDEKSIAERYKLNAQSIEIDYPVTDELLRSLAEQHLHAADQDSATHELDLYLHITYRHGALKRTEAFAVWCYRDPHVVSTGLFVLQKYSHALKFVLL